LKKIYIIIIYISFLILILYINYIKKSVGVGGLL
jgi:hypothetical protein